MAARDDEVLAPPSSGRLRGAGASPSAPEPLPVRAPRRSARVRAAIGGVLLLGLLGLATAVVGAIVTPGGTATTVAAGGTAPEPASSASGEGAAPGGADPESAGQAAAVIVHVLGAVRAPGIVELRPGDRVVDAIAAAGGTSDDADLAGVNLARLLADGEQLRVPRAGEVVAPPPAPGAAAAGGTPAAGSAAAGLVNINTADAAALEALPGVGPALAARIVAWREENGPFRAVDELLAVSGIGERTLDGMRDQVAL
ncbi:ComEA family DNA-binding protein [Microcella flavibacter]|uniref:ComEA family DNA-binding protein n=1 Tax=Microcella flavibacter TaxID=1804990 RepID=UPI0014577764|nr:ComEA family DNA-binding protein [Microcella flavibacter]